MAFEVGDEVKIIIYTGKSQHSQKKKSKRKAGRITGVYDKHVRINTGKYHESFSYVDIALGHVRIEKEAAV
ncbi:MAG: hypothetical protein SCK28_01545 [Bacillota bacterium]|nr:hypothetical protein [Bacillota bacterium]